MIPTDPQEREALAGEYALGTLDARTARELEEAMATDEALRRAVAAWEERLSPLTALAPEEAPPPGLWARIEAALDGAALAPEAAPPRPRWRELWRNLELWRASALGAGAAVAGLGLLLLLRPTPEARLLTVLLTSRDEPAWVVEARRDGAIRLAAVNPRPVAPDQVMQLWALPPGATVPTSLGLIPPAGQVTVTPEALRPEPGMLIEISLEPPGGSPTGRPTGPILFIGRLSPAGSS